MNRGDTFYPRVFALATAAVLGVAVFSILRPFLDAILWGLLLAFLLSPVNRRLRRALGGRRGVAALLLTLGGALFLLIPAGVLAVAFARQAAELVSGLQEAAARHKIARLSDLLQLPALQSALDWVGTWLPVSADQVQGWLVDGGKVLLGVLMSTSGALFAGALGAVVSVVLTMFLLFFFLRDGEELAERALRLIPLDAGRKARLVEHLSAVTQAVAYGALLTAGVQGILVGLGFALVGLPSTVVFGVLAAVAALLPLVGTALIWAPAAGILALQGRGWAALFMLVWGVAVVSMVDNFLRPLFISGRAQISTLPVFLGLLGGIGAFGPIGLVLGPVVVALVLALFQFAEESRAESKRLKP
ncbi:MAG TPA: AI-2E family transporter [Methylomirabilota bacterium]|nr:AI-2E family transporter [Methylomirabilota bacterium]